MGILVLMGILVAAAKPWCPARAGIMIDAHMVAMVKHYLAASAERNEAVDIASILLTIDANEKAVPSREEINAALSEVPGLRVSRLRNFSSE